MIALQDLLPSGLALGGLAGTLGAGLVFWLVGRVLTGRSFTPELHLVGGWGAFSFTLTLWGVATTASMVIPALLFVALALLALAVPAWRPERGAALAMLRILVMSLPIWAIMAAAKPALPDTFTNFLPNAVYLYDHGFFPADDRAPTFAVWPAFPYNAQLATYLATLPLPGFPPAALVFLNILLQLMAALLIARLLRPRGTPFAAAPSWGAAAGGLLLATALNPGFVPRIDFTAYAEPALTVGVALVAWVAADCLGALAAGEKAGPRFLLLALLLAALLGVKQVGIMLSGGLMAGMTLLALADRRIPTGRAIGAILAASLPALLLYGVWRWYVLTHFASGELKILPRAAWQLDFVPLTLANIGLAIGEKPLYFGILALLVALAVALTRRQGLTQTTRLLLLTTVLFAVYNAFLVLIYVIHMGPVAGEAAHSYFRYTTHLALLMVLALTACARDWWLARAAAPPAWWRHAPAAAILAIIIVPVVFLGRLRFDTQMPQPVVWGLARGIAGEVKDGDKLALLLPGDNGSVSLMLRAALALTPPRRDLDVYDVTNIAGGVEAALAKGYRTVFLSCDAAGEKAALLEHDEQGWRIRRSWTYPPAGKERWTGVLSAEPLCRGARGPAIATRE